MGDLRDPPEDNPSSSFEEETEPSIEWCLENKYKIPKWLLKCNIKCPFVKGKIFEGKYGQINYSVAGDPDSNLVLTFHGYNATHTTFSIYQSVLSKNGFRVIAFDLYGHGLSGHPRYKVFGNTFSPKYYVDQAEEVLDHLGYTGRKLSVVGMSMGACLAASFCERHPDLVEKLIFVSPAGLIPKKPMRVVFLKYIQCLIPCIPCCVSKCCFTRFINRPSARMEAENVTDPENEEYENVILVEHAEGKGELNPMLNRMLWTLFVTRRGLSSLLGIVNRMPLWTSRELYRKVGSSGKLTLILFGDSDTLTPPESAKELSKLFTNSHTIIFPNSDHLLSFRKPLQVVSSCLAFLGIPNDEKVEDYTKWLPFSPRGEYIPKSERQIIHQEEESLEGLSVDRLSVASEDAYQAPSLADEKPKSPGKSTFKIFDEDIDVPPERSLTNFSIRENYSDRRVPLVVVKQFEGF